MAARDVGEVLTIEAGRSMAIQTPWDIASISIAEPAIADVFPYAQATDQIVILGKSLGVTDLIVWSKDTVLWKVQLRVELDLEKLNSELADLFPDASINVGRSLDVYHVRGTLDGVDEIERLNDFLNLTGIKYVNLTRLTGLQQVKLQVRVAEVNRLAIRNLGINAFYTGDDFIGAITLPLGSEAANVVAAFPNADLDLLISALKENQYLQVLAEPTLVALSGEEASFLAGGEFPVPVVQGGGGSGDDSGSRISVEFKEFGIGLRFRPMVLGGGTIRLHVAPEVSNLTDIGAVSVNGFSIPSLVTRKAETTLELNSGQTFVMAGLLNHTIDARKSRLPILGDLPILGTLFRSVAYQEGESELVVLVTASLVEPLSNAMDLPLPGDLHVDPNDWELFIEGRLEGRIWESTSSPGGAALNLKEFGRLKGPGGWAIYHEGESVIPSYDTPN